MGIFSFLYGKNNATEINPSAIQIPTLLRVVQKLFAGSTIIFSTQTDPQNEVERSMALNTVNYAGWALLFDGAIDLTTVVATYVKEKIFPAKRTTGQLIVRQQHLDRRQEFTLALQTDYLAVLRWKNASRALLNTLLNIIALDSYRSILAEDLEYDRSVFSMHTRIEPYDSSSANIKHIYFPLLAGNYPLKTTAFFAMTLGLCVYNLREFVLSITNKNPRLNDPPIVGFLNTFALAQVTVDILTALNGQLTRSKQISQMFIDMGYDVTKGVFKDAYDSHKFYANLMWYINKLNNANYSNYCKNLMHVFHNAQRELWDYTARSRIIFEQETSTELVAVSAVQPRAVTRSAIVNHTDEYDQAKIREQELQTARAEAARLRQQARAFTPAADAATRVAPSTIPTVESAEEQTQEFFAIVDRNRHLEQIRTMRNFNQINAREIQTAINALRDLLPHGAINSIDGSEWNLTWRHDGKKYSLKYEIPHGNDGNQYRGRKLAKIINVLETGYLWGLGSREIQEYNSMHDIDRNLGVRLIAILTTRPRI